MMDMQGVLDRAGVYEYGVVNPRDVEFSEEVRKYCEENLCRRYGMTWVCPPAVGTVDECRDRAQSYDKMLVFSGRFDIKDMRDMDEVVAALMSFKDIAGRVDEETRALLERRLMLSNEGCGICESCTYPEDPCRYPEKAHGSIEGYGIWVSKLAEQAGMQYNGGENSLIFFGALLYDDAELENG